MIAMTGATASMFARMIDAGGKTRQGFDSLTLVAIAFCSLLLSGCERPKIPNAVSDREYAVYSAWINQHFEKRAPKALFLYSRTAIFAPHGSYGCGDALQKEDRVSKELVGQFDALGTAEYPLDFNDYRHNFKIPWSFKEINSPPVEPESGYDALVFSRVAFSRAGDEALFTAADQCAGGQCGGGSALNAHQTAGIWRFHATHCQWVY